MAMTQAGGCSSRMQRRRVRSAIRWPTPARRANVGPSLDELKPDAQRVTQAVKAGIGAMPAYTQLSAEQIQALARYVARASGAAK